jgi:hypothetical protein
MPAPSKTPLENTGCGRRQAPCFHSYSCPPFGPKNTHGCSVHNRLNALRPARENRSVESVTYSEFPESFRADRTSAFIEGETSPPRRRARRLATGREAYRTLHPKTTLQNTASFTRAENTFESVSSFFKTRETQLPTAEPPPAQPEGAPFSPSNADQGPVRRKWPVPKPKVFRQTSDACL